MYESRITSKMKNPLKILIITLLLIISAKTQAQFEYYSLGEGLSQANVRCLLQERNGFLWMGTQDGLNRFDGYQFAKFRREPKNNNSVAGNYISCITEDKDGKIFIGTINGVSIYDPRLNHFSKLTIKDTINNVNTVGSVSSLLIAKDGTLWIGDYYSGLLKISGGKSVRYMKDSQAHNSINDNYITSLCEDEAGNIWIGTFSSGINKYNIATGKFEYISKGQENRGGLSSNYISALCSDNNGNIIIGTTNGLNVLNTSTNEISVYKNNSSHINSISGNNILSLYRDRENKIWIVTEGNGVNVFNASQKSFSKIFIASRSNPAAEEKNIMCVYEDVNGNYWFGTSTSGVIKWIKNRPNFNSYTKRENRQYLSDYSIRSIYKDRENNLWIGTDNGLNKISAKSKVVAKYYNRPGDETSINDNKVWTITEDKKGNIWFGTQRGLAMYNKEKDSFERFINKLGTKETLPVFSIRCIYPGNSDTLWFGTYGLGLFSFDIKNGNFHNHTFTNKNPDAKKDVVIFQIEEERHGKLWMAAASGLVVYDKITGDYQRFFSDTKDNFSTQSVLYSFNIENDSTFWLGTLGDGLIKFNPMKKRFASFTQNDGLPNNVIYGILRDRKNNLWLSTNYGIARFNTKSKNIKNYELNDGIPTYEFNTGAFTSDKHGNLYFGGIEGLLFFNPDSIYSNTNTPKLAVTNFKVYDEVKYPNKVHYDGEEIILKYHDNYFSFEFSVLDLSNSANEYAYMLDGYDKEWIHSGKRRYAAYTNVDPGEYLLKVKTTNGDGVWSEKGIIIAITILPPFWATTWFRLIFISSFTGIILWFYSRRVKRFKKETERQILFSRKLIAAQEGERKRLAAELHDGVGQNLLIVSNLTQMGLKKPDDAQRHLNNISKAIKESIKDIRQISRDLHPYQIEELGVTIAIQSLISRIKESGEIVFHDFIENIDRYLNLDESINLFRIVQEAITNTIKHSQAKNVVISLSYVGNKIQLVISDDGIGISGMEKSSEHVGLGLRTMQERSIALNGNFEIESNNKTGTTIKVLIPK
ncbi:MAG: hypothetical protein C4517_09905 [Stygiobacter sp.]|nr:MAG: hypothetical protein C4517_09905 [Stygiobacter sp.]